MHLEPGGLVKAGSLSGDLPDAPQAEELFDILLESRGLRVERIVSSGQVTPQSEWLDQVWDEFVLLVSGAARLQIEGEQEEKVLEPADWVLLPARCRHRVTWTQSTPPTIWLAIHYDTARASA